jgi:hypothetical protein
MIQVTPRATEAAEGILRRSRVPGEFGLKLVRGQSDELAIVLAPAEQGDMAVPTAQDPVFIVAKEVAPEVQGAIVDLANDDRAAPRFVVRPPTA